MLKKSACCSSKIDKKLINNSKGGIVVENSQENLYVKILKGLFISFCITLIGILIFSIVLTYSNISETTVPIVIIAISFVSILIGSTISTRKISKNGMVNGGIIGGIYLIMIYSISSIISGNFALNMYSIIMIILGILAGLIGGILGINS